MLPATARSILLQQHHQELHQDNDDLPLSPKPLSMQILIREKEEAQLRSHLPDDDHHQHHRHQHVKCMSLIKHDCTRRVEKLCSLYNQWRQEQKCGVSARTEKLLNRIWTLDQLIEDQLRRFKVGNYCYYKRSMVHATKLRDVADMLMPKSKLPLENAALAWIGDWRPSAIFAILLSFHRSNWLTLTPRRSDQLSRLLKVTRIDEAILEQELSEYQATSVLKLPFAAGIHPFPGAGRLQKKALLFMSLQSSLKNIDRVITRAQKLRYKALELTVKKLLDRTQAAEFLVALTGIQNVLHDFAAYQKLRNGPVCITTEAFGT